MAAAGGGVTSQPRSRVSGGHWHAGRGPVTSRTEPLAAALAARPGLTRDLQLEVDRSSSSGGAVGPGVTAPLAGLSGRSSDQPRLVTKAAARTVGGARAGPPLAAWPQRRGCRRRPSSGRWHWPADGHSRRGGRRRRSHCGSRATAACAAPARGRGT